MDTTQIILIVFIGLLIIAYPILVMSRNKKQNQQVQNQTNSLKRGDKVLTTSGVYGTIVDLHMDNEKKIVTIETGMGKNKGYISIDAFAIYNVFKDEDSVPEKVDKLEDKKIEDVAPVVEPEVKTEEKAEIVVEEKADDENVKTVEAQIQGKKTRKSKKAE